MRHNYSRLFEPPLLPNGLPNPRHLSNPAYLALARRAARRGAVRNGLRAGGVAVRFPGVGFAPTRVTVQVQGDALARAPGDDRPRPVEVGARATAELAPDISGLGMPENATGGGYSGPLSYRQGKPMRPDVALAFDRMAAAARREAGLYLSVTSGYRSDAEQARLFAAQPTPHLFSALKSRVRGLRGSSMRERGLPTRRTRARDCSLRGAMAPLAGAAGRANRGRHRRVYGVTTPAPEGGRW